MSCPKAKLIALLNYIALRTRKEAKTVDDVLRILEDIESRIRELTAAEIEKELFL